jgi:hypothetical protein
MRSESFLGSAFPGCMDIKCIYPNTVLHYMPRRIFAHLLNQGEK